MEYSLIRNLGNCGSLRKLERITHALDVAIKYKTPIVIMMDPLVYGKNTTKIDEVLDYNYTKAELTIYSLGVDQIIDFNWWDIVKVNVLF